MDFNKTFYGVYYGYRVFRVNEFAIRSSSKPHQEFTNYAISHDFPDLVPQDEIWVSEENDDEELIFIIVNAVLQLKLIAQGKTRWDAYEAGLQMERELREKLEFVKYIKTEDADVTHKLFVPNQSRPAPPKDIYLRLYKTIKSGSDTVFVWVVNGDIVRDMYRTDFVEGGHGYVYPWVPVDEIWIDDDVKKEEVPFILHHEYVEFGLMRNGMKYEEAHGHAAESEYKMRQASLPATAISKEAI